MSLPEQARVIQSMPSRTGDLIEVGLLEDILEDCALRAELISNIHMMDNYEMTIAAAYIRRLIKTRGQR